MDVSRTGKKTETGERTGARKFPLGIGLYRIIFTVLDDFRLPPLAANVWRSVLGMQLRRMSEGRAAAPQALPMPAAELYAYFMETPPPPDARLMRRYPQTPHPWLLGCPCNVAPLPLEVGDSYTLPLTLFGRANELLAVIILALTRAAAQGLGPERGRMRLERVEQLADDAADEPVTIFERGSALQPLTLWKPPIPAMPAYGRIALELHSPLRLVVRKQLLNPQRFTSPYPLLMNLVRRTSMLCAFHGESELSADYATLKEAAGRAVLSGKELRWFDQYRWSSRTRQQVPLGGLMGRMVLDLADGVELWPFLWFGQWIHAGKGTALGLGRYELSPV